MAEETTVRITYGKLVATVKLSYRWYVQGDDPWELVKGLHIVPNGGYWWDRPLYSGDADQRLYDAKGNRAMKFRNFDRTKAGDWGWGVFYGYGAWYNIPRDAKFYWEIMNFD